MRLSCLAAVIAIIIPFTLVDAVRSHESPYDRRIDLNYSNWQPQGGSWEDESNWFELAIHPASHLINNGGTVSVTVGGFYSYSGSVAANEPYWGSSAPYDSGLVLGADPGHSGTVSMSAGFLNGRAQSPTSCVVGYFGTGTFDQTGGTHSLYDMTLGYAEGGSGEYNLSGGDIESFYVGVGGMGSGTFNQSGGRNAIEEQLRVNSSRGTATYNLDGGELSMGYVDEEGEIIFAGVENIGTSGTGTFNQSDGTNTTDYTTVGGYAGTGTYNQTGGTNTINIRLTLGSETNGTSIYDLSGMGQLSASIESVGYRGSGTFRQSGGANTVSQTLWVGGFDRWHHSDTGKYTLSGTGRLSAHDVQIGHYGTGTFVHSGGSNTIAGDLTVGGGDSQGDGTYRLSGTASLSADTETIGDDGATGTFEQSGGTNTIADRLIIGNNYNGSGTYKLSGTASKLSAEWEYVGYYAGYKGTGTFEHTSGTNAITEMLSIGDGRYAHGTYSLSGTAAKLSAGWEYVGYKGTGTFNHTGGTNTIPSDGSLRLGWESSGRGTYNLEEDAELSAGWEYVGYWGTGTFNQTGGKNTVTNILYIGTSGGGQGTYNFSGGTLDADSATVGSWGSGTLAISNGVTLNTQSGIVARRPDSQGTVTIEGAGSRWVVSGDLDIGGYIDVDDGSIEVAGGTAEVVLADGGKLSVGGALRMWPLAALAVTVDPGKQINPKKPAADRPSADLSVAGEARFGGTLKVALDDGFQPQHADRFNVADYGLLAREADGNVSHPFETVEFPGLEFDSPPLVPVYHEDHLSLVVPQTVVLAWDTNTPIQFVVTTTTDKYDDVDSDFKITSGSMDSISLTSMQDAIRDQVIQIFEESGVDAVHVIDRPADAAAFRALEDNATVVYFTPFQSSMGLLGIGLDSGFRAKIDRFNTNPDGTVITFVKSSHSAQFIAETVAHEIGHTVGLRHVNPGDAADPQGESVMDYDDPGPSPRFINVASEVKEPPDKPNTGQGFSHNPVYHLKRYVDGFSHGELADRIHLRSNTTEEVARGVWDDDRWFATIFLKLIGEDVKQLLYDVRILSRSGPQDEDPTAPAAPMHLLAQFDQIALGELSDVDLFAYAGDAIEIVASSTPGGEHDIVFATGDPYDFDNHRLPIGAGDLPVLLQKHSDTDPAGFVTLAELVVQGVAIPERCLLWDGLGDGNWNSNTQWTRGRPGGVPDAETGAIVRGNAVSVTQDASTFWLLADEGGEVVIDSPNVLTVAHDARIADATLRITGEATLNVAGNFLLDDGSTLVLQGFDHLGSVGKATRTIITADGPEGIVGEFEHVPATVPPGATLGNHGQGHLGYGVFLIDRGVVYEDNVVKVELLNAAAGDADGDGKVWLSDWATLRANFGNTDTDKTWTEGNFDPWVDDKVWLSDWAALRADFGNASYLPAGAAAVPEPGTIVMLLAGLAAVGWRRRGSKTP